VSGDCVANLPAPERGGASSSPVLSVIIPTHGRPRELSRCLAALACQRTQVAFEVIVVDDGGHPRASVPPIAPAGVTILRMDRGRGPAAARNLGAARARGSTLVFTDDDTIPDAAWLQAAADHLDAHPHHVGVEGPTRSVPYDALTEHSIENAVPGAFLTCNVAYRRSAFGAQGGFHEGFPYAHCEDLDLGFRLARAGEVGFASGMAVVHPPRAMATCDEIRRSRRVGSEVLLRRRHPGLYRDYRWLPPRLRPIAGLLRARLRLLRAERARGSTSPARLARWGAVTVAGAAVATVACLRAPGDGAP
jgi:GT2 family glycosyltransferase